jgi:hypothetical protein
MGYSSPILRNGTQETEIRRKSGSRPACAENKTLPQKYPTLKRAGGAWHQWLMPIILATWEVEIGRIMVQG